MRTKLEFSPPMGTTFTGEVVVLALCGDLILHPYNFATLESMGRTVSADEGADGALAAGLRRAFRHVSPLVKAADVGFLNLETILSSHVSEDVRLGDGKFELVADVDGGVGERARSGDPAAFVSPGSIAGALRDSGFTVVSTANNHAFDQGVRGVRDTLDELEAHGVVHVGTSRAPLEAGAVPECRVVVEKGIRIGFLAFTEHVKWFGRSADRPNPHVFGIDDSISLKIKRAREAAGVDFLVVSLHWGEEYAAEPSDAQRAIAQRVLQGGADLIVGHHPHILQPAEQACTAGRDRLVLYSLGTLFSHCDTLDTRSTAVAFVGVQRDTSGRCHIRGAKFVPVYVHSYFDPRFDKYVFEPAPIEQIGVGFDALQLIHSRLGPSNVCSVERALSRRAFEPATVEDWPSFADVVERDVDTNARRARRRLVARHLDGSKKPASSGCEHAHPLPSVVSEKNLVPETAPFEVGAVQVMPADRRYHFGCFFVFSGNANVDALVSALQSALNAYPHFAARMVVEDLVVRMVVDRESHLRLKVLKIDLDIDTVRSWSLCADFRQALCGDFAEVTTNQVVAEFNLVECKGGWICATSVQHTVTDLLGFWDFLSVWSKAYREGPGALEKVDFSTPEFFRLPGSSPLRESVNREVPPYSWGDTGVGPLAESEIYVTCDVRRLRDEHPGFELREILAAVHARLLASFAVPAADPTSSAFGLALALTVTLRKEMPELRNIVGSPVCAVSVGFPSAAAVLGGDIRAVLSYSRRCIESGIDLLKTTAKGLGLTSRVVEVGFANEKKGVASRATGWLNLSLPRLEHVRFEAAPGYFSRIRPACNWEMLVYRTAEPDTALIQVGVPKDADRRLVAQYLEGTLHGTVRSPGCSKRP